jgi:hypothetical protein
MIAKPGFARIGFFAPLLLMLTSCASSPLPLDGEKGGRSEVATGELEKCLDVSLYACLEMRRRNWLVESGGRVPTVVVDGVRRGAPEMLRYIQASDVVRVRRLPTIDAAFAYGAIGGPAIEVTLRRVVR